MASSNVVVKLDTRALDKLSKYARKNADDAIQEEAETIIDDIRANWSRRSPSSPGQPPAMVSGNLDASISERAANGGSTVTRIIEIKAYYADFLEYGTGKMAARPFIRPALARAEKRFPSRFKRVVTP